MNLMRMRKRLLERQIKHLESEKKRLLMGGYRQRIKLSFSNGRVEWFEGPAVVMDGDEGGCVVITGWVFDLPYLVQEESDD